jgi:hypothetical protein
VTLTGLTAGTTYQFAAFSTNAAGLTNATPNASFTTSASGPVPQIQNLRSWGVTGNSITMSWSTDLMSTTAVQYGTTTALGQTSPVQTTLSQAHGLTLTGLTSGVTYYYRAVSTNASNATGYSTIYSFTTLDTVAPVISNIKVTPAANHTAVLTWSLSEPAYSQIEYGLTTSYGLWSSRTALTNNPQSSLTWVPSGTIHYRIRSTDAAGNQTISPDYVFIEP